MGGPEVNDIGEELTILAAIQPGGEAGLGRWQ